MVFFRIVPRRYRTLVRTIHIRLDRSFPIPFQLLDHLHRNRVLLFVLTPNRALILRFRLPLRRMFFEKYLQNLCKTRLGFLKIQFDRLGVTISGAHGRIRGIFGFTSAIPNARRFDPAHFRVHRIGTPKSSQREDRALVVFGDRDGGSGV